MIEVYPNLFVGDDADCKQDFAVIHACKSCHMKNNKIQISMLHIRVNQEFEYEGNVFRFEKDSSGCNILNLVRHIESTWTVGINLPDPIKRKSNKKISEQNNSIVNNP